MTHIRKTSIIAAAAAVLVVVGGVAAYCYMKRSKTPPKAFA